VAAVCKVNLKCTLLQALRICTGCTARRGVQVYLYSSMTAALEGVSGQQHAPTALYTWERPGTHCTGGWFGSRAGLDRCGKSRLHRDPIADRPARCSVAIPTELPCPYILYIKYIIHIIVHIKDLFKPTFRYFLTKIIRNLKFQPATVHFAPPPPPQCY
jgi:hypothetical protein